MSIQNQKANKWFHQEVLALIIWGFVGYTMVACPETRTKEFWLYGNAKPPIKHNVGADYDSGFKRTHLEQGLSFLPEDTRKRLATNAK